MTEVTVNFEEVDKLIHSDEFIHFILGHSTNIGTAAFILDVVSNKLEELRGQNNE